MCPDTHSVTSYFSSLRQLAVNNHCRFGVVLRGTQEWNNNTIQQWLNSIEDVSVFQVGGTDFATGRSVAFNKGQQLLGQECQLLLCDLSSGWDANSFSAALGTLVGGGILVVYGLGDESSNPADIWLRRAFDQLLSLSEQGFSPLPNMDICLADIDFSQQQQAVNNIVKVVEGHRKRPLILTADRGRGKSSALGMAAAQLMQERKIDIVVTAPSLASVAPVFQFASRLNDNSESKKGLVQTEHSSLRFIAPDELLRQHIECDLLLVDEAAALPLPILQAFVERYHRAVFSSTIHGYEGCGRGFTLKFQTWLRNVRPNMRSQNMRQPIRWSDGDPLEAWHRRCFLLDFEFQNICEEVESSAITYRRVEKAELLDAPQLLHNVFSLLVNAHYQTSPNDLFHLLGDDNIHVFIASYKETLVGCILAVREGELDEALIADIQTGKRRPKGHLAPVMIANQLGISTAASQSSMRIMRIAVHPELQNRNIGSGLIQHFVSDLSVDYVSTCFGATPSLVNFWRKCGFSCIRIGSQRDQASGCYSLLMVRGNTLDWLSYSQKLFYQHLTFELSASLQAMESGLVKPLLHGYDSQYPVPMDLVRQYTQGGANFESIAVWLHALLLSIDDERLDTLSDLMVAKILQRLSWQECADKYQLTGRKQIEATLRAELAQLIGNLQCKPSF